MRCLPLTQKFCKGLCSPVSNKTQVAEGARKSLQYYVGTLRAKGSRLKTRDLSAKSGKQMFGNDTLPLRMRRSLRKESYMGNRESGLVRQYVL